jgi:hypothetical protein
MYNFIILSSTLFGSVYIHSKTLELINISLSQNKKIPNKLIAINVLTFMMSSFTIMYSYKIFYSSHFFKN